MISRYSVRILHCTRSSASVTFWDAWPLSFSFINSWKCPEPHSCNEGQDIRPQQVQLSLQKSLMWQGSSFLYEFMGSRFSLTMTNLRSQVIWALETLRRCHVLFKTAHYFVSKSKGSAILAQSYIVKTLGHIRSDGWYEPLFSNFLQNGDLLSIEKGMWMAYTVQSFALKGRMAMYN